MNYGQGQEAGMRLTHARPVAPSLGHEPPEWADSALCAQMPSEMFFVGKGGDVRAAKTVCGRCPYRAECLAFAMTAEAESYRYRYGIYAGLSASERHRLALANWKPGDEVPAIRLRYRRSRARQSDDTIGAGAA